jgi:hypothetical protein
LAEGTVATQSLLGNQFSGVVPLRKPPLKTYPFLEAVSLRESPLEIGLLGMDIFTEPSLEATEFQGWLC